MYIVYINRHAITATPMSTYFCLLLCESALCCCHNNFFQHSFWYVPTDRPIDRPTTDSIYAQLNSQSIDVQTKCVYIPSVYHFPWLVCSVTCVASDADADADAVAAAVAVAATTTVVDVVVIVTDERHRHRRMLTCVSARLSIVCAIASQRLRPNSHCKQNRPTMNFDVAKK